MSDETINVIVDSDKLTVGFFEDLEAAQETGKIAPIVRAYSELLGIDKADLRKLTMKQFAQLAERISKSVNVPNESAQP